MTKSKNRCPVCGGREWNCYKQTMDPRYKYIIEVCSHEYNTPLIDDFSSTLESVRGNYFFVFFDECVKCGTVVS